MNKIKLTGTVLAMTAAAAFSVAPTVVMADHSSKVHCVGGNACNGKSSCKTANNSCKGQNSCRGQGAAKMTKQQCKKAQQNAR